MRRSLLQVQHVASQELRPAPLHGDLLAVVSPPSRPGPRTRAREHAEALGVCMRARVRVSRAHRSLTARRFLFFLRTPPYQPPVPRAVQCVRFLRGSCVTRSAAEHMTCQTPSSMRFVPSASSSAVPRCIDFRSPARHPPSTRRVHFPHPSAPALAFAYTVPLLFAFASATPSPRYLPRRHAAVRNLLYCAYFRPTPCAAPSPLLYPPYVAAPDMIRKSKLVVASTSIAFSAVRDGAQREARH